MIEAGTLQDRPDQFPVALHQESRRTRWPDYLDRMLVVHVVAIHIQGKAKIVVVHVG